MFPLLLIILDGWGFRAEREANAVANRAERRLDALAGRHLFTLLRASGEDVGLPSGVMGNSEVGHLHIGSGSVVFQLLVAIDREIASGRFARNPVIAETLRLASEEGRRLHLMGLLSDGGVHSHQRHLYALVEAAREAGVGDLVVHAFLDGRDTDPHAGAGFVEALLERLRPERGERLGSMVGRYYAMDRDKRWERTERAFRLLVFGEGEDASEDPVAALRRAYAEGESDEFLKPRRCAAPEAMRVRDGDVVFFFNFRPDRARQLTRAFTEENFDAFDVSARPRLARFACMARYDDAFALPVAYEKPAPAPPWARYFPGQGSPNSATAETEKYAHVTYFLNGGREEPYPGEDRLLVPSPKVATYDLKPEMSAEGVFEAARRRLLEGPRRQFVVLNFANPDMVGHTGDYEATLRACALVDRLSAELCETTLRLGGAAFVTADHGNAEQMRDEAGRPHTAHTTNPVPFLAVLPDGEASRRRLREGAGLSAVAPTILEAAGLEVPAEMDVPSLWKREE